MAKPIPSEEDRLDQVYQLISLLALCVALLNAAAVAFLIVGSQTLFGQVLLRGRDILLIGTMILTVLAVWKGYSLKRRIKCLWVKEGYIYQMMVKALSLSWVISLAALVILPGLLEHIDLPVRFYTRTLAAIMLGVLGIAYLCLSFSSRSSDRA